jgi:hypothetical protein
MPLSHQVHTQEAGHQEIDVSGAAFVHQPLPCGNGISPAGRALKRVIDDQPSHLAFRACVVITVFHAGLTARNHDQRYVSGAKRLGRRSVAHQRDFYVPGLAQCFGCAACCTIGVHYGNADQVGCTIAEGNTEPRRKQDRKDEDPEHSLRLPEELAVPYPGELHQGIFIPTT